MRQLYTLYKQTNKSGIIWYARFWDENLKKYAHSRSLGIRVEGKRERRREAEEAAGRLAGSIGSEIAEETLPAPGDVLLTGYVENFWMPDGAYAREKVLVEKNPLSRACCKTPESIKKEGNLIQW